MGTSRYTNYQPVNWDIPIWSPDWKQVDNLLTNQEQGYQLAQQALNAPIDSSNLATDSMVREQLRLDRQQAEADLAKTYAQPNGLHAGNQALQSYLRQIQQEKQPGGVEYQLLKNKTDIEAFQKQTEAKESWSPEKKQAWLQDNLSTYKGAVSEGELKGFSGQELSKYVDGITMANKIAKEMIPKTTEGRFIAGKIDQLKPAGRDLYADERGHLHWDEATGVELTPQEIMIAVTPQMQLNPEWQAYSKDNSRIELFQGNITEKTWQPLIQKRRENILTQLDIINNSKNKQQLVSELSGKSISELSEYKPEELESYIEKQKAELNLENLKLNSIKSYDDLISYHSNENTTAIAKSAGDIYKRDDLKVSPKNITDEFFKLMMADDLKRKAEKEAKQEDVLDPNDYWYGNTRIFNTKISSDFITNNKTYKQATTNFNEDSKQSAIILTALTNEYNDALKNPNNNTGNILKKAGWDFDKQGKFFDYQINPSNGIITFKEPKWNELNKQGQLSGKDFQELQKITLRFNEQAKNLNAIQNNQLSRILLYQTKTGDLNITDNLQDVTEDYKDPSGNIIKNAVSYKQIQELEGTVKIKYNSDRKVLYDEYLKKDPKAKDKRGFKSFEDFNALLEKEPNIFVKANETSALKPYGESYMINNKKIYASDFKDFSKFVSEKFGSSGDKKKAEKEKSYDKLMSEFDGIITTTGREYYMNALAYNDTKSQNAVKGKSIAAAEQIMSNIKSYATAGQVNSLINMNGLTPIGNQEDLNKIVEAMTKMRLPDPENPDKLMQINDKGFTFNIVDGELYGVANVIFDKEESFNGNDKNKGIAVGFKIDNTMPQLKSWLMNTEQLASEFELQQQKTISNDLNTKTVSKIDYPILGGSNLKANIIETISPSLNKQGFYSIQLYENNQEGNIEGQTNNVINLNTNNPYFPTELGNYVVNLERNKDNLALMKELKFNNNDTQFKNHILEELKEKESNLTEVQLNAIYDRFIQPRIKNGKSPTLIPSPGNFTNPQGFQW